MLLISPDGILIKSIFNFYSIVNYLHQKLKKNLIFIFFEYFNLFILKI